MIVCIPNIVCFVYLCDEYEDTMRQCELNLDVEIKGEILKRRRTRTSVRTGTGKTSRQEHVYKRNRELIARYYYWTEIRRRRRDAHPVGGVPCGGPHDQQRPARFR